MKRLLAACVSFLLLLSACGAPTVGDVGPSQSFFAMDTVMLISLVDGTEEDLTAAVQRVNALDAMLSRTREDSALSKVNAAAGSGTLTFVPDELYEVVSDSLALAERTGGAFHPAIGPLTDLWGFSSDDPAVPSDDAISSTLPKTDWHAISLTQTPDGSGILLQQAGMSLDLGGIGKGYAAHQLVQLLQQRGVTSALLSLGGNITAMGTKKDGSSWSVAVQDPQQENAYLCIFPLQDQTASTSGSYERFFEENGIRYSHILDPDTGYPVTNDLLSVTVVCSDPVAADALSTALFVMGEEQALEFWRTSDDFECILVAKDGTISITEGLMDGLQMQGKEQGYHYETIRR